MKTIVELKDIILKTESGISKKTPKEMRADGKLNELCRMCVQYLETNPRQEFVESEVLRIEDRINLVQSEDYYAKWITGNREKYETLKDPRKSFEGEFDLSLMKKQLKTLKFILK